MKKLSEQQLDDWLRRDFADDELDDQFTSRVMHVLPPRKRQPALLLPVALVIGAALAWLALLPSPLLQGAAREWLAGDFSATIVILCVFTLGTSLLSVGWALEEAV